METGLPNGGRLLITQITADGNFALKGAGGQRFAIEIGVTAGANFGQQAAGDVKDGEQFRIPIEGLQVHQHGAAGISGVGDMGTGQIPD